MRFSQNPDFQVNKLDELVVVHAACVIIRNKLAITEDKRK